MLGLPRAGGVGERADGIDQPGSALRERTARDEAKHGAVRSEQDPPRALDRIAAIIDGGELPRVQEAAIAIKGEQLVEGHRRRERLDERH
jgi:hypothetical protein